MKLRKVIKNIVKQQLSERRMYGNDYGWGIKQKEHPNIPWVSKPVEDHLHYDKDVFKRFMKEILGLDEKSFKQK